MFGLMDIFHSKGYFILIFNRILSVFRTSDKVVIYETWIILLRDI